MYTLMLVSIVNKKRQIMDNRLSGLGFSRVEWQLLAYLSLSGGCLPQKQLKTLLDTDLAFLSRALDKLTKKHLIIRKINEQDRRQRDILLTRKGTSMAKMLCDEGEKLNADLMQDLSATDVKRLHRMTRTIEQTIKRLCEERCDSK
jgi:DNA-binding MarR family transcriptional regulator